jgi:AcrR family transcriptional regulator
MPVRKRSDQHQFEQRQKILRAASHLFVERGYLGTSVDAIASTAHVNKAIIYYYFKNKASVLYELVSGSLRELIELNGPVVSRSSSASEKLEALIGNHIRWQIANHWRSGIGYIERKNLPRRLLNDYIRLRDQYEGLFRTTIEEGIRTAEFAWTDPKLTSLFILGLVNSVILWYKPERGISSVEIISQLCRFIFMEGLVTNKDN